MATGRAGGVHLDSEISHRQAFIAVLLPDAGLACLAICRLYCNVVA